LEGKIPRWGLFSIEVTLTVVKLTKNFEKKVFKKEIGRGGEPDKSKWI